MSESRRLIFKITTSPHRSVCMCFDPDKFLEGDLLVLTVQGISCREGRCPECILKAGLMGANRNKRWSFVLVTEQALGISEPVLNVFVRVLFHHSVFSRCLNAFMSVPKDLVFPLYK